MRKEMVSVYCTVKNAEETIVETIDSVINQTYKYLEFVIVDDGSTDNTINIIKDHIYKDNRIKLIETEGIGRGKALNLAVENCKSNIIANIDADDIMHPEKIKIQYKVFKSYEGLFLLSTNFIVIKENVPEQWPEIQFENTHVIDITNKNIKKNQVNHSSVMLNRSLLKEIGGYQNYRKSQYDYELWLRAGLKGHKFLKINQQLVGKRIHKNQSFESKRIGQLWRSVKLQSNYIIKSRKIILLVYPIARMLLGLLPFKLRRKINSYLNIQ